MQKDEMRLSPTQKSNTKIKHKNQKWFKDLNFHNYETTKKTQGKCFMTLVGLGQDFSDQTSKVQTTKVEKWANGNKSN